MKTVFGAFMFSTIGDLLFGFPNVSPPFGGLPDASRLAGGFHSSRAIRPPSVTPSGAVHREIDTKTSQSLFRQGSGPNNWDRGSLNVKLMTCTDYNFMSIMSKISSNDFINQS